MGRVTHQSPVTRWPYSEWEFREAKDRIDAALALPRGQRGRALRSIATDYGVNVRSLYRWRKWDLHEVRIGRYVALFSVNGTKTPAQITRWERAA